MVRKTISVIFERRMGYKVVSAIDGAQAGALFTCHASDLALLVVEIDLPNASGPDFVKHLPTLEPRIPVLFITSMGDYEVQDAATLDFPVLRKPFKADTLITAVKPLISADLAAS